MEFVSSENPKEEGLERRERQKVESLQSSGSTTSFGTSVGTEQTGSAGTTLDSS